MLKKQTLLSMTLISTLALLFNANAMEPQNDEEFQVGRSSRLFDLLVDDPREAKQAEEIAQKVATILTQLGEESALYDRAIPYFIAYDGQQPVKNHSPEWVKYGTLLAKFTLAKYLEEGVDVKHVEKLAKSTKFHLALARAGFGASDFSREAVEAMDPILKHSSFFGVLYRSTWSLGLDELSDDQKSKMKENLGKIFDEWGASNIQDTMSLLTPFTRGMSPEQRLDIVSRLESTKEYVLTEFFYSLKKEYTNGHYEESKFNGKLTKDTPENRFKWLKDLLITIKWEHYELPR